jgi:hypothetical protein
MRADTVFTEHNRLSDYSMYESWHAKEGRLPLFIPEGCSAVDITTLQLINTFITKQGTP